MLNRCRKKFSSRDQIFHYKSFSKEDIQSAHIECKIFPFHLLTDPRATIVFQPTARAAPARTKTLRCPVDRLEGGQEKLSG